MCVDEHSGGACLLNKQCNLLTYGLLGADTVLGRKFRVTEGKMSQVLQGMSKVYVCRFKSIISFNNIWFTNEVFLPDKINGTSGGYLYWNSLMCLVLFYNYILSEGLEDGYDGDIAFASALETFGGETNDPDFMALGGN